MNSSIVLVGRRTTLTAAIVAALVSSPGVLARTVGAGQTLVLDNENTAGEVFTVNPDGILRVIRGSRIGTTQVTHGIFELNASAVTGQVTGRNGASLSIVDSMVTNNLTGPRSNALALSVTNGAPGATLPVQASISGSALSGGSYASTVDANAALTASASHFTARDVGSRGIGLFVGSVTLADGSVVEGSGNGVQIAAIPNSLVVDQGRSLVVDASTVRGLGGSAIRLDDIDPRIVTDATIVLRNGAVLEGANGVAIDAVNGTRADITIDASDIAGDIRLAGTATANIGLVRSATLTGTITGGATMDLGGGTTWTSTGDSDIAALALNGGTLAFQPATGGAYRSTIVRGDLSGSGGAVALNTEMNAGGPLSSQRTDRLLIEGDVTTTGPTEIVVTPNGTGAGTDTNGNGVVEASEGISLVQVGGTSRADAFALRGGYVAAGAYQYTLHAFGPGQTDPSQNQLANGPLNWDYRLGNRVVCDGECPVDPPVDPPVGPGGPGPGDGGGDPENPGAGDGGDPGITPEPPRERVAVVPQLPSYLSAPAALLTYGDMMTDGLHQRLGDIRRGTSNDPVGGEVFARYLGGQLRYSSNLSFKRFGYDFDQQVNALQLGGSLIALDGDNGSLRAGWAAEKGTTRVTPNAADGNSSAKYRANGVSGWITWQHGDGVWADGVLGTTRYRGDVGTDMRGDDVGRIRANGWTASIEAGVPIALGGDWTVEPRFQLKHQQINFRDFVDGDGLDVRLGTAKQTSATLGGRITRTAQPLFMPYASVDLSHSSNGDPTTDVSSDAFNVRDSFATGRKGNAYRVAAGAVSQVGQHVQLFGEGTYQHFVGGYGMRGWAGNLGIRVTF